MTDSRSKLSKAEMEELVLIKRAYLLAVRNAKSSRDMTARIAAVVMYDFALESALKAAVRKLGSGNVAANFPGVVQQLDNLLLASASGQNLKLGNEIHRVHELRNAAQHRARYPNESELSECFIYTRDGVREILRVTWNVDFDSLSIVDLIQHDEIQERLRSAELALRSGRWQEAVGKAAGALMWVVRNTRGFIGEYDMTSIDFSYAYRAAAEYTERDLYRYVMDSMLAIQLLTLGVDVADYWKVMSLVGPRWSERGYDVTFSQMQVHITEEDAVNAFQICVDSIAEIQRRVGSLKYPLGYRSGLEEHVEEFASKAGVDRNMEDSIDVAELVASERRVRKSSEAHGDDTFHVVSLLRRVSASLTPTSPEHAELLELIESFIIELQDFDDLVDPYIRMLQQILATANQFNRRSEI